MKAAHLEQKCKELIKVVKEDPFQSPPPYESLRGEYAGLYSRRLNIQHRFVYLVDKEEKEVVIISVWSHYER